MLPDFGVLMANDAPKRRVKSADNIFDIITYIQRSNGASPKALAKHVDLAPSTVYEYLSTLEYRGYVVENDGEYDLAFRFLRHGGYVRDNEPLYDHARKWIKQLAEETDEICSMSIEENGKRVSLHLENDKYQLRNILPLGETSNLHSNSAGKAILAELSDERIDEIIREHGLPEQTENTITDREQLFKEIETIRDRGYALNLEERRVGWHAVATGITHPKSHAVGAISIAGPTNRLQEEVLENELAESLLRVKNEIELEISFSED